jgi:hypothetical protein
VVTVGNAFNISLGISQRIEQFREVLQVKGKMLILTLKKKGAGLVSCGLAVGIFED